MIIEYLVALKWVWIILQVVIAPVLIILVLLQSGKGDDIGSALSGGGGAHSVLGTGGTSKILVRGTVFFAIAFMVNSIVLAKVFKEISQTSAVQQVSEPLVPAPTATNAMEAPANPPSTSPVEGKPSKPAASPVPAPKAP